MREIFHSIIHTARRFKLATTLNIIGLTAAFASFYLLMTEIAYQRSYNQGLDDYQLLYRLESNYEYNEWDYSDNVCRPFAEALKRLPQVESVSLMRDIHDGNNYTFTFLKDEKQLKYDICWCNATALSTLTDRLIDGSLEWAASDTSPNRRIIPASIAKEYFGTTCAAGKQMKMLNSDTTLNFTVMGVYEDFPENSELPNCIYGNMGDIDLYHFSSRYKCYVKFASVPTNLNSLCDSLKLAVLADLDANADKYGQLLQDNKLIISNTRFKLTPLSSSYFEYSTHTSGENGFKPMNTILEMACLLIILIASINFLNFTLAESPLRMRSVNTRLVLGADRHSLRLKLIAECIIVSVITCLVALAISHALQHFPVTGLPMSGSTAINDHWLIALLTIGTSILVGIMAGCYPAIFTTSFPPALVLKGSFGLTPRGRKLRTMLVCLQLFITMLMVNYIGILLVQSDHILNAPYGFEKDQLLYSNLKGLPDADEREVLVQSLMRIPDVESVTFASTMMGATDGHYVIKARHHGHLMGYNVTYVDPCFMRTMGIKMVDGHDFTDDDSTGVIINEAAHRLWSWLHLGDYILTSAEDDYVDSARIVGVSENIRYGTLRVNSNQPFAFILDREYPGDKVIVRIDANGDFEHTRLQADRVVSAFSDDIATPVAPYNDSVSQSYRNELRFFHQVYLIAFLSLMITLIGLFCLTMFETEYRRKEIGIRKVAGATTAEIVWMLCRHYGWLILICFAVATPIAWRLGQQTLNYFADQISIQWCWWVFALGLLLVGSILMGTVVLQGWIAARENPTTSIRTE